ncbi:MAG TPA: DUF3182 family protein [Beijerinckiaceae bacterium]|jgi:hypothetical protein
MQVAAWPETIQDRPIRGGAVVVHAPPDLGFADPHEEATRREIARRLAGLRGAEFAGPYEPALPYLPPVYFVTGATLVGIAAAQALGIRCEHDLFGGVVPHAFVATKAITHPLVRPDAEAPDGWSEDFPERVRHAALAGFSAFSHADAAEAGARLLAQGPVRVKPVQATAGRGQTVVADAAALADALAPMDAAELAVYGLVLEENLTNVTTYSVGQVRVADLVATYWGTQRLTFDGGGEAVYGGSDLVVARGGFDALLALGPSEEARLAVAQARAYDEAAGACFPGLFASRRNYDVAQGLDAEGRRRSGVLEQSWRMGGASSAEIGALEAFRADPDLAAVRASSMEVHGGGEPPPHAAVYFRGVDERLGPLVKYAVVEPL